MNHHLFYEIMAYLVPTGDLIAYIYYGFLLVRKPLANPRTAVVVMTLATVSIGAISLESGFYLAVASCGLAYLRRRAAQRARFRG